MQSVAAIARRPQIVPSTFNPEADPFGLLNINAADENLKIVLPRAKVEYLATGDAPSDFRKGHFSFSLGYQKQEVRMVILAIKYGRVMFPAFNGSSTVEPLCKSATGVQSTGGSTFPADRPMQCAQCTHAKWSENPPPCQEVFSLLGFDVEDELPFVIGIRRTSIISLRKWKSALKLSAKRYAYPGCAPNASVSMLMRAKPVNNYYVVEWPQRGLKNENLWERLPEQRAKELTKVAMDLSGPFADLDLQQIVDVNAEGPEGDSVPF